MPVMSFSSSDANRNVKRTPVSVWPDGRKRGWRLDGIATIEPKPSFTFSRDDLIMTMGSCFAREIESALLRLGFELPTCSLGVPGKAQISAEPNGILNKYTVQSMANEIEWAFSSTRVAPEDLFVEAGEGLWHDPHLIHTLRPSPWQDVVNRRGLVENTIRRLPECRVIVVTLGVAEAWFDQKTGLYLNSAPPHYAMAIEPDRFRLDVLSYDDIAEGIERLLALFKRYGHPDHRVLMTVSPVPFKATFTGTDALAANTYSKAVQRAAVQAAVYRHDHVDYFPSYEIVTLTDRKTAFDIDNIHPHPEVISEIMRRVVQAYVPDIAVAPAKDLADIPNSRDPFDFLAIMSFGHAAMDKGDYALAASHFSGALFRFAGELSAFHESSAYAGLVRAMQLANRLDEALRYAEMWRAAHPHSAMAAAAASKLHWNLKQGDAAIAMIQLACELEPANAANHLRWATLLIRHQRPDEARLAAMRAIELDPALEAARDIIAQTAPAPL